MKTSEVKALVRGPLAPVLTIYKENDLSLDLDAIQENVDQLIRRGMTKGNGTLLAAGAGGDFPLLSLEERKMVIKAVAEAAGDRATVIGCAQSTSLPEAVALAEWSQRAGCYAIQISPTWYYPPNDAQVFDLFMAVAESVDICVMVYNTPGLGTRISVELLNRLWEEFDNVRAIKWNARSTPEVLEGFVELSDRYAMINNSASLLASAWLGATGFVTHLVNVWPEQQVAFWKILVSGEREQAIQAYREVQWPWGKFRVWAYREIGHLESMQIKPAAEMTGFHGGPSRPPFGGIDDEKRAHIRYVLEQLGAPLV